MLRSLRSVAACGILLGVAAGWGCAAADTSASRPSEQPAVWPDRAEAAQASLTEHYWNPKQEIYTFCWPADTAKGRYQYWWQAHALDVLVDGFERTGNREYLDRALTLWKGVQRRNGGVTIDYYDDMEWMAIALLRLAGHADDAAIRADVDTLWSDIKTGWNDQQGGGIAWRKSQRDYKNTPANAPAAILAARLYQQDPNPEDLEWARRIYAWLNEHLVDPDTGFVWDGKNREGNGRIDKGWAFTYNQGVRIGAAVELYRATGERAFLDDAARTFHATVSRMADAQGLIHEEGNGDKGLFKGILFRYLTELALVDPEAFAEERAFVEHHAEVLWGGVRGDADEGKPLLFPSDWSGSVQEPVDLTVELSGVMLLEQRARLEAHDRAGE